MSAMTTQFLGWCCHRLLRRGKKALLLIWDNASWHKSREVRLDHRPQPQGQRKQPWSTDSSLLPAHQESVAERHRAQMGSRQTQSHRAREALGAYELADRVCGIFDCPHYEHLSIAQEVA